MSALKIMQRICSEIFLFLRIDVKLRCHIGSSVTDRKAELTAAQSHYTLANLGDQLQSAGRDLKKYVCPGAWLYGQPPRGVPRLLAGEKVVEHKEGMDRETARGKSRTKLPRLSEQLL